VLLLVVCEELLRRQVRTALEESDELDQRATAASSQ
jgi:hypothetical protein